jgi:hypothetical protein
MKESQPSGGPISIPSLDAVSERPELTQELPREISFKLYLAAQRVAATCALALARDHKAELDPAHDELINAREAARVLSRSVSWVQQRAREVPLKFCLVRSLGRGLLFSRRRIDRLIAHEVGQNPDGQALGLRGVNSGRRPRRKGNASPPSTPTPRGESGRGVTT